jgi:hypothetical protein
VRFGLRYGMLRHSELQTLAGSQIFLALARSQSRKALLQAFSGIGTVLIDQAIVSAEREEKNKRCQCNR